MSDKHDGGAAFSCSMAEGEAWIDSGAKGMSLLDWFAGRAMQSLLLASLDPSVSQEDAHPDKLATAAYGMAIAMIQAQAQ